MATELVTDSIVMSSTSENQDPAWQFVQFVATPEQQAQKDVIMGGVPCMPEETEIESRFTEDPYFRTFVDMSEYGVPAPQPAVWQPFEDIIINMVQSVFLEQATPGQAIEEAAQAIRREQLEPPSA
jgi:multiple sugar transport system substrate-binding protein